jgi:hypothetical protein
MLVLFAAVQSGAVQVETWYQLGLNKLTPVYGCNSMVPIRSTWGFSYGPMPAQVDRFYGIPQGDSFARRMMHNRTIVYSIDRNDLKKDLKLLQYGYDKVQGQRHDTRAANWCIVGSKEGEHLVSGGASGEGPSAEIEPTTLC